MVVSKPKSDGFPSTSNHYYTEVATGVSGKLRLLAVSLTDRI